MIEANANLNNIYIVSQKNNDKKKVFINDNQKKILIISKKANWDRLFKKFWKYVNFYNLKLVHVTLTLRPNETVDKKDLNKFHRAINYWLKQKNNRIAYIRVSELTKNNKIHFHVVYAYEKAYSFPAFERISKLWGKGFIFVKHLKKFEKKTRFIKYLKKYLTKDFDNEINKVRRVVISQINRVFALSKEKWDKINNSDFNIDDIKIRNNEVYVKCKLIKKENNKFIETDSEVLIMKLTSDWVYLGVLNDENILKGISEWSIETYINNLQQSGYELIEI